MYAVNDFGEMTGADGRWPARWSPDGTYQRLPMLPDVSIGGAVAQDINNLGITVGSSATSGYRKVHAVSWDNNGDITDLGTLPGDDDSAASAINDLGEIVGTSNGANGGHAVTWNRTGTISALPDLPGDSADEPLAVSDTGFIVGDEFETSGATVAVLWH